MRAAIICDALRKHASDCWVIKKKHTHTSRIHLVIHIRHTNNKPHSIRSRFSMRQTVRRRLEVVPRERESEQGMSSCSMYDTIHKIHIDIHSPFIANMYTNIHTLYKYQKHTQIRYAKRSFMRFADVWLSWWASSVLNFIFDLVCAKVYASLSRINPVAGSGCDHNGRFAVYHKHPTPNVI